MPRSGLSGQSGQMDFEHYLEKMERTNLEEDPNQVHKYMRESLKDLSCDTPAFESDQPRRKYDAPLTLRHHGRRSETMPYLPDGTFLDWQFLAQDPRSIMKEPDFTKAREHQESRGKHVNFKPDGGLSIPETGLPQSAMIRNIKGGLKRTKAQMKIFEESLTSWNQGGGAGALLEPLYRRDPNTEYCTLEEDPTRFDGPTSVTRRSHVTDADVIPIGYHSIPDQRLKIASYSKVNPSARLEDQNWHKNRYNSTQDSKEQYHVREGLVLSHGEMLSIIDVIKQKQKYMDTIQTTNKWDESSVMANNETSLFPNDIIKQKHESLVSQQESISAKLSNIASMISQKFMPERKPNHDKSIVDHRILNSIVRANNKQLTVSEFNDLRSEIQRTASTQSIFNDTSLNKAKNNIVNAIQDRFATDISSDTFSKENNKPSKPAMNYKSLGLPDVLSKIAYFNGDHVVGVSKTFAPQTSLFTREVISDQSEHDIVEGIGHADNIVSRSGMLVGTKNTRKAHEFIVDENVSNDL